MHRDTIVPPPATMPEATPMNEALAALLARERASGFRRLQGSTGEIAVPIRQAVVDKLVAQALAGRGSTTVRVDVLAGARLAVEVSHVVFGLPARARAVLELERDVDLQRQRIVLRHGNGLLWRTLRGLSGTFGLAPAGVSFGEGAVEIDLRTIAARGGWSDLLAMLRRLVIHGPADGLLAIEADVEIRRDRQDASHASSGNAATTPAGDQAPRLTLDRLLEDFAGSRARVELLIDESLVNDVIAAARADQPSRSAPPALPPWRSFVHDTRARFEPGRLVLALDVELPDRAPTP
jgi:hypothetical protein